MKSPINWFGGKFYMRKKIIDLFPVHKTYVEVFGGSAHLLFDKPLSKVEIYNDINKDLVLFFKTMRNPESAERLKLLLELTPYSRQEFYDCLETYENIEDDIERVRRWYVVLMQSFSSQMKDWTYTKKTSRRGMSKNVSAWLNKIDKNLLPTVERLRTVQIENLDFELLIQKYDNKETFFYLDPPYVHETRSSDKKYQHEMKDSEHQRLVEILTNIQGMGMLSGFDNDIYNRLEYNSWHKVNIGMFNNGIANENKQSLQEEYVWINY